MSIPPIFTHTNLIAKDWQALAAFYEKHFDCLPVPPERNYPASTIEAGTGLPGLGLRGAHLRLPGCGADRPTLEGFAG